MHFVGFVRVWYTQFDKIRVQEGSPVLIVSCPKGLGLLRVSQYSILDKKCQNTQIERALEKGFRPLDFIMRVVVLEDLKISILFFRT